MIKKLSLDGKNFVEEFLRSTNQIRKGNIVDWSSNSNLKYKKSINPKIEFSSFHDDKSCSTKASTHYSTI